MTNSQLHESRFHNEGGEKSRTTKPISPQRNSRAQYKKVACFEPPKEYMCGTSSCIHTLYDGDPHTESTPLMNGYAKSSNEAKSIQILSVSDIEKRHKGLSVKSIRQCRFSPMGFAVLLLMLYLVIGLIIGMKLEKWNFTNTMYYIVSTLTTVGYGDIVSNSTPISRISTALFVFIGVSFIGFAFGVVVSELLDREDIELDPPRHMNAHDTQKSDMTTTSFCGLHLPMEFYSSELSSMRRKLVDSWILVLAVLLFGTLCMSILEDWPIDRSFYWSCVTVTTVGFGDVIPTKDITKWFSIGYMVVGTVFVARSVKLIASIPLTLRKLRMQEAVISQWHNSEAIQTLLKANTLSRLGLRDNEKFISKAEFVLHLLLLLDAVKERDLNICCRHYDMIASDIHRSRQEETLLGVVSNSKQKRIQSEDSLATNGDSFVVTV